MSFVHLHLHTEYSLLDGLIKIKPLVKRLKEMNMNACAMTDHGNMYGLYEFWSECKKNDIKPILGCEVYVAPFSRFDKDSKRDKKRYHLTLLAKNQIGYHNLIKITSYGHTEGFYTKPRVDREILEKYSEGIIATTGCAASPVNRNLLHGNIELAYAWAKFFKKIYGENFYSEIQRNGVEELENAVPRMIKLANDLGLKVIATCDAHYLNKSESSVQEINWCIRDAKLLSDPNRNKKWSEEFYVKSPEEMFQLFADIPTAITNTQEIADSIEFYDIKYDRVQPLYPNKISGISAFQMLKSLCYIGASLIYPIDQNETDYEKENVQLWWEPQDEINQIFTKALKYESTYSEIIDRTKAIPELEIRLSKEIKDRLDFELEIIHDKGYDDYFLVVADFMNWAKAQGMTVGVRGSVAGALVAYTSGITDIDPLRWKLYFERFLNPERPSPPDIDCDLQDDRRTEIIEYIENKYGQENCSLILALGRLKTRAAIKDVSRVMGIPLATADKLSKMVVVVLGQPFKAEKMMSEVPDFADLVNSDPRLIEMIETVKKIEDMPRQAGVHACGMLITPHPVVEYAPLQLDSEGRITCQLEMKPIEEMGLMKFDLLGLANFTIISKCISLVKQYHNIEIDILNIPQDDPVTFELLKKGNTDSVFQLESSGMKKYLKELQPTTVDDLCFMVAAYRPGPMQFITPYIKRKYGQEKVDYLIPELEPILKNTYGLAIYQEQVIRIAVDIAGYSMGEADMLRRAMGKKIHEIMEAEGEKFIDKCVKKGYSQEIAEALYNYMKPFADYGFNKAHAAQYAMIAYQTAYLKANYPIEFITACLQVEISDNKKLKQNIQTAIHMNLKVLPPDINSSSISFTIENGNIRFGLGGVKGISHKAIEEVINIRSESGSFASLDDMIERVGTENLTQSTVEILIKIGALDSFGNRKQLLKIVPAIMQRNKKTGKDTFAQDSLFAFDELAVRKTNFVTPLEATEDFEDKQKISWENEYLGTFFSNHPLTKFQDIFDNKNYLTVQKILESKSGKKIRTLLLVKSIKKIRTKRDNKEMAFLQLEDLNLQIESAIFNSVWEKVGKEDYIKAGEVYEITGKLSERERKNTIADETAQDEVEKSLIIDEMKLINDFDDLSIGLDKIQKNDSDDRADTDGTSDYEYGEEDIPLEYIDYNSSATVADESVEVSQKSISSKVRKAILDLTGIKDKDLLNRIKECIQSNPGNYKIELLYETNGERIVRQIRNGINIDNNDVRSTLNNVLRWK